LLFRKDFNSSSIFEGRSEKAASKSIGTVIAKPMYVGEPSRFAS
jgi:hypothetical protein